MLISVIIPVYNSEKYIHRCINSILSQTYINYEIILIDDGSTDNSDVICDEYADKNEKIKVIHQKNYGPGPSRNTGISQAVGDYIIFVDCDDYIFENTFVTLAKTVKNNNYPDAILFDYVMGNEEYAVKRNTIPTLGQGFVDTKNAILNSAGATWCKMYKTSIIAENSISFPDLQRKEDFVFNKIALSYCNTVFYLKEHLYFYFNNTKSIMHTTSFSEEVQQAAFKYLATQISSQYTDLVDILKINNYLISAVQNMCVEGIRSKEIREYITEFECNFPKWFLKRNELILSNEFKLYLFLIHKKQISLMKILFPLRKLVKKLRDMRTGE